MNHKREKIYSERVSVYKCPVKDFEEFGISIIKEDSLKGKNKFTAALVNKHTFIRVDPAMQFPKEEAFDCALSEPKEVLSFLSKYALESGKTLNPSYNFYYQTENNMYVGHTDLEIKQLDERDQSMLDDFFSHFSEAELEDADIDFDQMDPIIFGGFIGEEMVAYASHRYPSKDIADIGVLVKKTHRGKGYGKAVVGHDMNWCLKEDIIPMYVVLSSNAKSIQLVESLNFEKIIEIYYST